MDYNVVIAIVAALVSAFLFFKLVLSPLLKAFLGITFFIVLIYILQEIFSFDLNSMLSKLGISLNTENLSPFLDWVLAPVKIYLEQAKSFINFIWQSFSKSLNQ